LIVEDTPVNTISLLFAVALMLHVAPPVNARGVTRTAGDEVQYGRDIRGILSDRCFECHGPDPETREAGLRLDLRSEATRDLGGRVALVPGSLEESELWHRITTKDQSEAMPPAHAKKAAFTADERAVFARWIEAGAEYEDHWAFVTPVRPELPTVRASEWARNPLDAFVLERLEAEGWSPSPAADRATLLRRVFLDLTGLPPTVAELDAFLSDESDGAYESWVDRLLTQEPYRSRMAERLATPWLDASRYADTCGIHQDNGRQAWHWRDWVLAALRDNMPFDQFVTEQLAGDLLPDATTAQRVASGFHRNQVTTDEGGAISDEYLVEYAVDRVNTTGAIFMGLTLGCARCHDHKYDPLTQEDFYGLFSFFNSIDQPGLYSQTQDSNRAYEPFVEVPSPELESKMKVVDARLAELREAMDAPLPGEDRAREEFLTGISQDTGLDWSVPRVIEASSSDEQVRLDVQEGEVVVASGPMAAGEEYTLLLESTARGSRVLLLEALSLAEDQPGAGRADHGNAVLTQVRLESRTLEGEWNEVPLQWAWADHTQAGRDFEATNVLHADARGWAVDGNENAAARTLLLLSEKEFGGSGNPLLRLRLEFRSPFSYHSLGRMRVRLSPLASAVRLPVALGRWYSLKAFTPAEGQGRAHLYDTAYGPETVTELDLQQSFGEGEEARTWQFEDRLVDEAVTTLAGGLSANFIGRTIWSPDERQLEVSLGSDDGLIVYLNGESVLERRVDRGAAPDQDQLTLSLRRGRNTLVMRIVNTGGPSGYYFRALHADQVLTGELPSSLLPDDAVPIEQVAQLTQEWRRRFFASYRTLDDEAQLKAAEHTQLLAGIPRAMVMKELGTPRQSYVLMRGQYDAPDITRPVASNTPGFLPPLPEGAPQNRLGLAQWLVAPEHPLFARVNINRLWQMIFGNGIVRTSQDFGLQGDWPTHPALLDWLAVEFRESGWDVHGMLRSFVTSSTYRQASRVRTEFADIDPDNQLLSYYPRRRLGAEEIRDGALFTSGLLVEQLGGRSVKTYQPAGLWAEVAMLSSNTRRFVRDEGDALWRRSMYTYWKRAVPPPSLQTFDAPTRESCVIQRQITNTPLQALVLWNDEQYVEASRALALRTQANADGDRARLIWLVRTCAGRTPDAVELDLLQAGLDEYRLRFQDDPESAEQLSEVGEQAVPVDTDLVQLAAWSMLASAVMNLHESLTVD
jgi:hypothetical protein